MNSGPRLRIRSIRSKRFWRPWAGLSFGIASKVESVLVTHLRSTRGEVLKGPEWAALALGLCELVGDLHVGGSIGRVLLVETEREKRQRVETGGRW
jgi:hypothetical protein